MFAVLCSYKVVEEVQEGRVYSWLHDQRGRNQKPEGLFYHRAHTPVLYQYETISGACHSSELSWTIPDTELPFPEKSTKESESKTPASGLSSGSRRCVFTDLSVCYADEPLVHQFVCFGVSGLSLHDVALSCFISQRDGGDL